MKIQPSNRISSIVLLLLLVLILALHVQGQDSKEVLRKSKDSLKFQFGLKIGGNTGLFRKNNNFSLEDKNSSVWGYQAGIYGSMGLLNFLRVRTEVAYFTQGTQAKNQVLATNLKNVNGVILFNNIQIPVLLEMGLPSGSTRLKLLMGGFYSYSLNVQSIYDQVFTYVDGSTQTAKGRDDVSYLFKHNQYGLIIGIGVSIPVADKPLLIDLRYTHTLNNIAIDGFQYGALGSNIQKYGSSFYPSSLSLNVSYPIFNF